MTSLALDTLRMDGGTQSRAIINDETVADYAEQMTNGDVFPAITVYYDGADYWLPDGFHRVRAAQRAGFTEFAADVRQGSLDDARWHSYSVNQSHGLRRSNEDKKRSVSAALQHPYADIKSDEEIARHCGVSAPTVAKYRSELGISKSFRDTRIVTRNGKQFVMSTANIGTNRPAAAAPIHRVPVDDYLDADDLPAVQIDDTGDTSDDDELTPYEQAIAARFDDTPPATADDPPPDDTPTPAPVLARQPSALAVVESVAPPRAVHQLLTSSESNEWYTPAAYIEAARLVMGAIDLDPASNAIAQQTIKAARYFTIEDDGFNQEWGSASVPVSVWLNPPYGKTGNESNAARWSRKLLDAYRAGTVAESVLLVNANTGDGWFAPLKQFAVCFPDARIRFYSPTGEPTQPMHSNALVYFGPNVAAFVKVFSQFGTVMGRLLEERGRVVSAGLGAAL